ncbi:MAG: RnfABCDGE type electron transport complex subunit D [candidate division KSB1 bacterium]|nr:RnfABCDGE type electron transport complex subunit D [candidate division KSB1 bacterium]
MEQERYLSASPHVSDGESIPKIMYGVVLALLPAAVGAVYFFGLKALWIILIASAAAIGSEAAVQAALHKRITVADGSALVTGILVAFNVPASVPLWMPALGAIFGILVGKHAFGGLGYNPMNPALLGRAFLLASWPTHMTVFTAAPRGGSLSGIEPATISALGLDAVTQATPLKLLKGAREVLANSAVADPAKYADYAKAVNALYDSYGNLFWGKVGGCIGETSAFLLLVGALFLLYKRYIGWKIPFAYLGTVALLSWIFAGTDGLFSGKPLFHLLSGGVMLGAFYMATDMVTSPVTFRGRLLFGAGCGVITMIIRLIGGYPEGVCYSILLMNLTVPLLDRSTRPRILGEKK